MSLSFRLNVALVLGTFCFSPLTAPRAQEKPTEGEVVAVGPGLRNEAGKLHPPDVKVGDRVLFGKWSGTEMKRNGEDLMIMKEADLLAVIDRAVADQKAA